MKSSQLEGPHYTYVEWKTLEERKKEYEHNRMMYFVKQKVCGVVMILTGIIILSLPEGDVTCPLTIALPIGLYLLFTNRRIMVF